MRAVPSAQVPDAEIGSAGDADAIAVLRQLVPARPLNWNEARSLAERQAGQLLDFMFLAEPPIPMFVVSSLPGILVEWKEHWPVSGMSAQAGSHWRIVLRAEESRQRQRFSLGHELKHVLDHPTIDATQAHLKPHRRQPRAERLCNYFAACLLMPRPWVKHDYYDGLQNVRALARRYYVSEEAMSSRLNELGLVTLPPRPRSGRPSLDRGGRA